LYNLIAMFSYKKVINERDYLDPYFESENKPTFQQNI